MIYLSAFLIAEIFISLLTIYSLTVIEMLVFMGEPLFVFVYYNFDYRLGVRCYTYIKFLW